MSCKIYFCPCGDVTAPWNAERCARHEGWLYSAVWQEREAKFATKEKTNQEKNLEKNAQMRPPPPRKPKAKKSVGRSVGRPSNDERAVRTIKEIIEQKRAQENADVLHRAQAAQAEQAFRKIQKDTQLARIAAERAWIETFYDNTITLAEAKMLKLENQEDFDAEHKK